MGRALVIGLVIVGLVTMILIVRSTRRREPPAARPDEPERPPPDAGAPVATIIAGATKGERGWDVFSRLLKERIIFLGTQIDDDVANVVVAALLFLEDEDPKAPITLYVNSPGGFVTASLAILDTMDHVKPPVHTVVMGQASGTALMIAAHGERGHRSTLPAGRYRLSRTTASLPDTDVADLARTNATIVAFLAADTGQPEATIARDAERERAFTAEEARAYGLVDDIFVRRPAAN